MCVTNLDAVFEAWILHKRMQRTFTGATVEPAIEVQAYKAAVLAWWLR